jgi:hypothetical protein
MNWKYDPAKDPVKRSQYPEWFLRRVRQRFGCECPAHIPHAGAGFFDHCGTAIIDGREAFVSEPYYTVEGARPIAEALAAKLGLEVAVSATAAWHPKAIRIAFMEAAIC